MLQPLLGPFFVAVWLKANIARTSRVTEIGHVQSLRKRRDKVSKGLEPREGNPAWGGGTKQETPQEAQPQHRIDYRQYDSSRRLAVRARLPYAVKVIASKIPSIGLRGARRGEHRRIPTITAFHARESMEERGMALQCIGRTILYNTCNVLGLPDYLYKHRHEKICPEPPTHS